MNSDDLTNALGRAVTALWGDLPASVQHDLFEASVRLSGEGGRESLAAFLHHAHRRTTDGEKSRAVFEPDSLGGWQREAPIFVGKGDDDDNSSTDTHAPRQSGSGSP
jgi:hypothetical protein